MKPRTKPNSILRDVSSENKMNWSVEKLISVDPNKADEWILVKLLEMEKTAQEEYRKDLIGIGSGEIGGLQELGYRMGKVAALNEAIQMARTGVIPT